MKMILQKEPKKVKRKIPDYKFLKRKFKVTILDHFQRF